jgi:preprotein translocase subunit SecF
VVFDKVRENTRGITGSNRYTYSDAANLAVNQTIVRSINTTLIALLPVGAILVVGTWVLGAGPLKDLSLALFVGIAVGAYSSIFIAPALLATFKEREPGMQALRRRVTAKRAGQGVTTTASGTPVAVAAATAGGTAAGGTAAVSKEPRKQDRLASGSPVTSNRPIKSTSSAGRPQPSRKPRSKRGK